MEKFFPRRFFAAFTMWGVAACGGEEEGAPPPITRPVKIFVVSGGAVDAIRTFPGRVDASQRAELAFRVSGKLQDMMVKEGDLVEKDQVLARLDPSDYALVLEDRQAKFDNSKRNFQRARDLVACLLYTSDAADERSSVDLGGRRIIKKKKQENKKECRINNIKNRIRIKKLKDNARYDI